MIFNLIHRASELEQYDFQRECSHGLGIKATVMVPSRLLDNKKITDKAKKAVQSQTNSTFVNTLTKSLVSASSAAITVDFDSLTLDDTTGNSLIDVISGKLTDAYNELQTYNVMLDSLISIT